MRRDREGHVVFYHLPGNKYFNEFTKADKPIGQKTQATDQGKSYYNRVRSFYAFTSQAETGSQPFGAGIGIGSSQPFAQVHHVEDLVEYRPQPGYPDTFNAVHKTKCHHPHSAADIKHIRGITHTQHIPGKFFTSHQVAFLIGPRFFPEKPAQHQHRDQVGNNNTDIDQGQFHSLFFSFL